ncbi:unnamed protein product [Rhizophagus irregularis]|nr:unnamed protein product [Rhizophagus irregularis]
MSETDSTVTRSSTFSNDRRKRKRNATSPEIVKPIDRTNKSHTTYFFRKDTDDNEIAYCILCERKLAANRKPYPYSRKGGSTSNLAVHLQNKHGVTKNNYLEYLDVNNKVRHEGYRLFLLLSLTNIIKEKNNISKLAFYYSSYPGFSESVFELNNMAPPTSPISQRTRSGTANSAELLGDSSEETFQRGKTHDNISAPYNINKPLEPKEVSNRRDTRKKKQQVQFSTNITGPAQQEASPIFLHRSPETINNNVDQSNLQNSNVNKDDGNKQTPGQITGQSSADQNIPKPVNKNVDQQIELPDIDMIDSTHEDVLEQPRKLEQEKILAKLHVQIDDAANIDEYRKFIKVVQNHILEDIGLKQENIINLQTQVITQTNDNNNKDKQKENGPSQTPRIITGIALLATIISRETLNSLIETPYSCDNKEYYFEEVITAKAKQLQKNKNSRDRVVQIFNASLRLTTAIINTIYEEIW